MRYLLTSLIFITCSIFANIHSLEKDELPCKISVYFRIMDYLEYQLRFNAYYENNVQSLTEKEYYRGKCDAYSESIEEINDIFK